MNTGLQSLVSPGERSWRDTPQPGEAGLSSVDNCVGVCLGGGNAQDAMRIAEVDRIDPEPFPTRVERHGRGRMKVGSGCHAATDPKNLPKPALAC